MGRGWGGKGSCWEQILEKVNYLLLGSIAAGYFIHKLFPKNWSGKSGEKWCTAVVGDAVGAAAGLGSVTCDCVCVD